MNSDIYMGLSRQIFLFLFCVLVTTKACTLGWFGSKCQFMCHCSAIGICDDTGRCSTKCDNEWFGQSCQYQDLATIPGATITAVPQQETLTWLTDRDETTCNQSANLTTIQISWDTSFPFTWLRLNIYSPALTTIFTVTLKTTNHLDISCNKLAITIVDPTTLDLRCDMGLNETVTQIILTGPGVKSICSLYINGGRNVALHQSAEQSSTYTGFSRIYSAPLAVDGNTNCYLFFNNSSTTHTDSEPSPSWTLTLDTPRIVNRFVIYNRADTSLIRLKNFILTAFDINNKALWSYQDQNPETALIYKFTRFESDPVSKIRIVPTSKESFDIQYMLTLCEVFMYGDCVPGNWGLECNKTCPVECPGSCHQGTGTCFICQGRSDPPLCNTACPGGQWGPNCTNQCSISCYDGSCDRITGQCDKGCNGFINPPFCNTVCEESIWGQNCSQTCNPNCQARLCHNINGECIRGCVAGFVSPDCTQACPAGQWGVNCTNSCSVNCYGQSCDKTTGICDKGCQGFSDPPSCTTECAKGNWGPNCQFSCRNNCFNLSCDSQTGKCDNGCDGFMDAPDCTVECKTGKWGRNCVNQCKFQCKDQSCDRVTGLCDYTCDSRTNLSCPDDCPKGYHGSNCTLDCSSTCKDLLCNRLGYCIACVSGYTGRYCEKVQLGLASETSGLTFSSGVGIGVAVGALVIILIDVAIVIICRTRLTTLRARSNDELKPGTRLQNYDGVKQINDYNHSYEPSRSTFEETVKTHKKQDREANETVQYENTSNTVYETIG